MGTLGGKGLNTVNVSSRAVSKAKKSVTMKFNTKDVEHNIQNSFLQGWSTYTMLYFR